ncbi:hypothetical protein [Mycolicibacterium fallax]|uniref:hypothetical protein n=1 Tax=Mycolicibacterium fallax TaxID=1793 RepID=UPI00138C7D03|nr:hypothetical protein [Mycolicibacterium fallax]BBZ00380.1 hypothetical protein MFAL_38460 [Mycolicibacterium fallax]
MTTIARRIAATATLAAAPALIAIGLATGANAAPAATHAESIATTTISSPAVHPDKKDQTRSNQSWSARHRYHSNHR